MQKGIKALNEYREKVKTGEIIPKKRIKPPSISKAVRAKCAECSSDYADGRVDCEIEGCSLYWWQPYGRLRKERKKKN